jgi:hypothetical protein
MPFEAQLPRSSGPGLFFARPCVGLLCSLGRRGSDHGGMYFQIGDQLGAVPWWKSQRAEAGRLERAPGSWRRGILLSRIV